MYKVGELVKWMRSLEEDYSYGYILSIEKSVATVVGTGYYRGVTTEVHLRYIKKVMRGGGKVERDKKYIK